MTDTTENWSGDRSLEEHFPGFLGKLQSYLTDRQLPNYWQPRMNFLKDLNQKVLEHMASRLAKMKVCSKMCTGCVFSELVPLRGHKRNFKPRPQNRILVPLKDSFQNFQRTPPSFYMGVSPGASFL